MCLFGNEEEAGGEGNFSCAVLADLTTNDDDDDVEMLILRWEFPT